MPPVSEMLLQANLFRHETIASIISSAHSFGWGGNAENQWLHHREFAGGGSGGNTASGEKDGYSNRHPRRQLRRNFDAGRGAGPGGHDFQTRQSN